MQLHSRLVAVPILALALTGTAVAQAGDAPQIISAQIDPSPVHPGGAVDALVTTSPDVTGVDVKVKGLCFHLDEVEAGEFHQHGTVPKIARFFRGTYRVTFVATGADGAQTETEEDVTLN